MSLESELSADSPFFLKTNIKLLNMSEHYLERSGLGTNPFDRTPTPGQQLLSHNEQIPMNRVSDLIQL